MKTFQTLLLYGALSATLTLGGLAGCSTWGHDDERSTGRAADDEKIEDQVKNHLRHEPVYKFNDVDVKTFNGVVQLNGFVNTEDQKRRAGELAEQVPGVAQVVNNISLKAQVPSTATGRTP